MEGFIYQLGKREASVLQSTIKNVHNELEQAPKQTDSWVPDPTNPHYIMWV